MLIRLFTFLVQSRFSPGQLGLVILLHEGTMRTSETWSVSLQAKHTARCTNAVSVVWQCKLVSGWGLQMETQISAPLYGYHVLGRTLGYFYTFSRFAFFLQWRNYSSPVSGLRF